MKRPNFITQTDIERWDQCIEDDKYLTKDQCNDPKIRELCYAGIWLYEKLIEENCPDILAMRIQYTAAKLVAEDDIKNESDKNPWTIHQMVLDKYNNNELEFEEKDANHLN